MKAIRSLSVALALVGPVSTGSMLYAQVPAGVPASRAGDFHSQMQSGGAVNYGPLAKPQYNTAQRKAPTQPVRTAARAPGAAMPNRVANMPQHQPIKPKVIAPKAPVRTASATYGQPTPAGGYMPPSGPVPMSPPVPPSDTSSGVTTGDCGSGGCGAGGCGNGQYPYGPTNRTALLRGWYVPFWHSTGDMPQHNPYFPNAHGYYYFRPYNVVHVLQQQEMVGRWGLDPRNPMDNRFFERIYQEQEAAQMQEAVTTPQQLMSR